ncbi:MAG: 50S ribosomal protein L24 [Myxococcales bacterium]|jgi:large subunit ribosomal protein L24|nr:50S ribosomal protein L24 [Myxococcales bacterium]
MASRIKKGDLVAVIAGKDKGETGTVLRVDHERDRVLVEGRNLVKRHQSAARFREAGIIEKEAWIHASNVMLVDPQTQKPTRVRFEERDGKKVRVAVKSGAVIDN